MEHHGPARSDDPDEAQSKRDKARDFAHKAKDKAKELFNPDDKPSLDARIDR